MAGGFSGGVFSRIFSSREKEPVCFSKEGRNEMAGDLEDHGQLIDPRSPEEPDVHEPAKLLRIAFMLQATLDEVRKVDVNEFGLDHLKKLYGRTLEELKSVVSQELQTELEKDVAFPVGTEMDQAELRVAQARLAGWLEGLFRGIQASTVNQQLATELERAHKRQSLQTGTGGYI